MSESVLIFGLDGATYTVLGDLVRRGVMPYLGEFMSAGARGSLMSTIPPLTPPAWTTLVTGRSPGAHGIFNFLQFDSAESPYPRIITSREVGCETLWSMVGRSGRRAGCLNFVAHSPAPKVNGYVIPGWVPWRWVRKHSHPRGLIDRIKRNVPCFDVQELAMNFKEEEKAIAGTDIHDYTAWIDLHIRREGQWFECLKYLMVHDPCDLVGIVFDGVDKLQHLLWRFLDPALEVGDPPPDVLRIRERCWDYFRLVDGFLRETVRIAGDDALVLIVSDHGFCGTDEIVYINTWLEQQGFLTWSADAPVEADDSQELGEAHPYHLTHMDLSRTKAYATSASSNGIHISVAGVRGKEGIRPEQYESFRAELRDALLTRCLDPVTGEPLIPRVWTREEVFAGPKLELAPDLTVSLRQEGFFSILRSNTVLKARPVAMGCHHPEGVLIARGPGVRQGSRLSPASLLDIAPTVLNALRIDIPEDLEGSVISEMFTNEWRDAHPVTYGPATSRGDGRLQADTEEAADLEGEAQVLMRLRALGYIE